MSTLIRINSNVYSGKYPSNLTVTQPGPIDGDTRNLNGAPVGGRGNPEALLEWKLISVSDYQIWTSYIPSGSLSTTLTDLVLPDDDSTSTVAGNSQHTAYSSAELWRPEKGGTVEYNGNRYVKDVRIKITEMV